MMSLVIGFRVVGADVEVVGIMGNILGGGMPLSTHVVGGRRGWRKERRVHA